jgi:hypothetical protein
MSKARALLVCAFAMGAAIFLIARWVARSPDETDVRAVDGADPGADEPPPSAAPVRSLAMRSAAPDAAADCAGRSEHCSEPLLMSLAAELVERDPERARALLQQADERFGARHELRRVLEIEALVRSGQVGLSHGRASHFYRSFPDSRYAADVERLTGYHPRPAGHE